MRKNAKRKGKTKQEFHTITVNDYFYAKAQVRTFKCKCANQIQRTGLRQYEEVINIKDLFEWHKRISFDIQCQWNEHLKSFVDTSYATHTVIKINTETAMKMVKENII